MAEEKGKFAFYSTDSTFDNKQKMFNGHTDQYSGAALAITDWSTLTNTVGNSMTMVPPLGYCEMYLFPAVAGDIIESEESDMQLIIEYLDPHSKAVVYEETLNLEDFTGFKPSGTIDITLGAIGVPIKVGHFQNNTAYMLRFKPHAKAHIFIGDDT